MSISVGKAFEAFCSDKYNKTNVLGCMLLIGVLCLGYLYAFKSNSGNPASVSGIIAVACYLLYCIMISGYAAVLNNNEFKSDKDVFPSLTDFLKIFISGLKYLLGSFIISIILGIVAGFIFGLSTSIIYIFIPDSLRLIALISICIIVCGLAFWWMFRFLVPLILMFFETLKLKSLFSFKETKKFLDDRKGFYFQYLWKAALAGILIGIISFIMLLVLSLLGAVFVNDPNILSVIITIVVMTVIMPISLIIQANINGQFINLPKAKKTYNW